MTQEQVERWRDFAMRMVRQTGRYRRSTRNRAEAMVEHVIDESMYAVDRIRGYDQTDGGGDYVCDIETTYLSDCADEERIADGAAYQRWKDTGWRVLGKCAIRAGIDMAGEPGGGVVGYVVGDLRKMYPEGIPAWVCCHYEVDLNKEPPDAGVWL